MDGELFSQWFRCHFLKYVPSDRDRLILLLFDGHSSYYNPQTIREAARAGVILFCLPPNTTHVAQPLDVSPFNSLKVHWDHVCDQYMSTHPGKIVTIYEFSQLFAQAWHQAMIPTTIMGDFRATGVYPFNRHAIHIPGIEKNVATPTAKLAHKEGIRYLPFYSPHPSRQSVHFSQEHRLFEQRYEEDYNIQSPRCLQWLQQQNGPQHLSPPSSQMSSLLTQADLLHQVITLLLQHEARLQVNQVNHCGVSF